MARHLPKDLAKLRELAKSLVQLKKSHNIHTSLVIPPQLAVIEEVAQVGDRHLLIRFPSPCIGSNRGMRIAICIVRCTMPLEGSMEITDFHLGARDSPKRVTVQRKLKDLPDMLGLADV